MRADVNEALAIAGLPPLRTVSTSDPWNQDYFETGFMSMPASGGKQHVIRVLMRSANTTFTNGDPQNHFGRPVGSSTRSAARTSPRSRNTILRAARSSTR